MVEENNKATEGRHPANLDDGQAEDTEIATRPGWREALRQAFDKARREQQPTSRRELGRDRSRSLFLLAGAAIAVLLLFLGVFSSSNRNQNTRARRPGSPDFGRTVTPGQQRSGAAGSVTPLLNAQTGQTNLATNEEVTPQEIGRTARLTPPLVPLGPAPVTHPGAAGRYALGNIHFSDGLRREQAPVPSKATEEPISHDLRQPSLVFVRSAPSHTANASLTSAPAAVEEGSETLNLPAGTRLMARLQAAVSSAIKTPVVAAIEYNYERDGKIIVPAGAQVIGNLRQADRSGYVGIRFNTMQMPDGFTEKLDATAMSLRFGPLKGVVSGKRTKTHFLIRALTGIGQAASLVIGSHGLNAPLSQGALVRDQIATNIGIAGDQQLNSLAFNQNIVVSVPANTRFYVVIEKGTTSSPEPAWSETIRPAAGRPLPTAEELRQLIQLQRELSALYPQASAQNTAPELPQP